MRLYVARHGQTEANIGGIMCGWHDSKLTHHGIEQAEGLADALNKISFDTIITSDLSRARDTGKVVLDDHPLAKFDTTSLLRERSYGVRDGIPNQEIIDSLGLRVNKLYSLHIADQKGYESDERFAERIELFFEQQVFPLVGEVENMLLVCHKGTCNAIAGYIRGWPASHLSDLSMRMELANTAYSVYEIEGRDISIVQENVCDHVE